MARILVCHDDRFYLAALENLLQDFGHQVSTFRTTDMAILALQDEPYDLAILDVLMPGGGAISMCHEVKSLYPNMPVIICTGRSVVFHSPVMERGLRLADAKIEKTIDPNDLRVLIERLLNKNDLVE